MNDNFYIPKDLDDCFVELHKLLSSQEIKEIKNEEEADMVTYHNYLGRDLRNEWGLWTKSCLYLFFYRQGIIHADDMSDIILNSFWRHLNLEPIKLEEQIKSHKDYWEKSRNEYL